AHVNPSVTAALCIRRRVSPLRTALYVAAQCGGGIAGAAAIYGRPREPLGDSGAVHSPARVAAAHSALRRGAVWRRHCGRSRYLWLVSCSGAHVNPSVTAALCIRRRVSPLRTALYVAAQCGGGIAGAAAIY
ncbi:Uncharacterized protein OBRU01_11337, partial [Operophtera brumata]